MKRAAQISTFTLSCRSVGFWQVRTGHGYGIPSGETLDGRTVKSGGAFNCLISSFEIANGKKAEIGLAYRYRLMT